MKDATVLVIEDETQMRRMLRTALEAADLKVIDASTAREGLGLARSHNPDVVLLDLGLPDGDGVEVTRALRTWSRAPILVLSARGREQDKVQALDAGADDYLTKPFGIAELLARLRVALRRAAVPEQDAPDVVETGALRIDLRAHVVTRDGVELHLTRTAYRVLAFLARHAGRVVTHRQILADVWGPDAVEHPHYVRVQMAELRKKIERDPARPQWLVTEQGVGYRLRVPTSEGAR